MTHLARSIKWLDAMGCPFCSSINLEVLGDCISQNWRLSDGKPGAEFFLCCRDCKCTGPNVNTMQGAFDGWNRRHDKLKPIEFVEVEVP